MRSVSLSPLISTVSIHYISHKSFDSRNLFNPPSPSFSTSTSFHTMPINLQAHAFAGNPIKLKTPKPEHPFSPSSALQSLNSQLLDNTQLPSSINFKVLPFRKGRPLATFTAEPNDAPSTWHLGWIDLADFKALFANSTVELTGDLFVYLGSLDEENVVYWAVDVSSEDGLVSEFASKLLCFVEVRTLMVAADWADARAMGELAIAGHARALLEWHNVSKFCGHCGGKTVPAEAGKRKQCSNPSCKKKVYPRVDPVVIMLVIDRENDRALLSKQSRFVPRMWSCLAGFIEPGESLEEAVKRETWEETGIEVGEVVYHSSQPWPEETKTKICLKCERYQTGPKGRANLLNGKFWEIELRTYTSNLTHRKVDISSLSPLNEKLFYLIKRVGPSNMPCQLMVGFFAYAKSFDINVDKGELEDAQWHSREDVRNALTFAEYEKAQTTAAAKVEQMCKGVERQQSLSSDFNVESGELAPMFVPGPFAIAHHLISSWVCNEGSELNKGRSSLSSL